MKMRIPIVMGADENYITPARVAIWTMRKSTCADVVLDITILCSEELEKNARCRLQELENSLTNVKISFYEVNLKTFHFAKPAGYISIVSFFRLIVGEVLQEDKCLYLDGDIIVNIDLQELYLQDVEDFYLAGVRDIGFLLNPEGAIRHGDLCGFNYMGDYVNAGVLVLNLAKIREDHLQEQFLESMKICYPCMDQDILNKICEGKIKHLDLKYNYFSSCGFDNLSKRETSSPVNVIWHFAGGNKPWNNYRIRGAKEWWRWAKEALEEKEYNRLYAHALEITKQSDWSYIVDHCMEEKTVIVIGYSQMGADVYKALVSCKTTGKVFICDNSKDKRSLSNETIIIYSLEELAEKYPDALWLNTSRRHSIEIKHQLRGLGVEENRILTYVDKPMKYFEMLDDEYVEYELQQIQLKVMGYRLNRE